MPTRPKMQNSAHANSAQFKFYIKTSPCVYLEGGRGSGPPPENSKNIAFSSNTGPDPLKNRSYQDTIQCWAIQCWTIIGTPAKRHLMAFRWRADDDPLIVVLGCSLPSSNKKNNVKVGPPLTKHSGSAHELYSLWSANGTIRKTKRRI